MADITLLLKQNFSREQAKDLLYRMVQFDHEASERPNAKGSLIIPCYEMMKRFLIFTKALVITLMLWMHQSLLISGHTLEPTPTEYTKTHGNESSKAADTSVHQ